MAKFNPVTDPRRPTVDFNWEDPSIDILTRVKRALQRAGYTDAEIEMFSTDAQSNVRTFMIDTVLTWVNKAPNDD